MGIAIELARVYTLKGVNLARGGKLSAFCAESRQNAHGSDHSCGP
jgi:hypothetical protein